MHLPFAHETMTHVLVFTLIVAAVVADQHDLCADVAWTPLKFVPRQMRFYGELAVSGDAHACAIWFVHSYMAGV